MRVSPANVHSEIALKGDDYELNVSTTTEFSSQHRRIHGNGTNLCSLRIFMISSLSIERFKRGELILEPMTAFKE